MKFLSILLTVMLCIALTASGQQLSQSYRIKSAGAPYHRVAVDAAGNTFVFGTFDDIGGKNLGRLVKLDAAGQPIATFPKIYADGVIEDLAIQTDQKILISGKFTQINGQQVPPIVRLNSNGTIDAGFNTTLTEPGEIELQSTGKIIVRLTSGVFERLNTNGSIDASFNFQNYVYSFAQFKIAPDNSIYLSSYSAVHKLTADGADDNSFTAGAGADQGHISAISVQTDGKVLVGGYFNTYNGVASKSLIRLNSNGTVDNGFSVQNNIQGQVFQIVQRSNGKILIGGQFTQFGNQAASLVELNTDGTLFRNIAVVYSNNLSTICEGADSKITIAGGFISANYTPVFGTARFNTNYTMDLGFKPQITFNNSNSLRIVVDPAMNMTIMGDYDLHGIFNGPSFVRGKVVRINAVGGYNSTFKPIENANVYGRYVQDDGKVIASGGFGNASWEVTRFNADGSKDPTFNIGSGPTTNGISNVVYTIRKIGDLIYLGGYFSHFNGAPSQSLVAVNSNGSVVKTFTALPANAQVNDVVAQSDGKLIVSGYFNFGPGNIHLVRLNTDGTLDQTFHQTVLLQPASDIAIDEDDNIFLSGESLHPDGSLLKSVIKLDPTGFVDGSFSVGSGFAPWGYITAMELLPDGRIAVGGHFDAVQGVEQPGFAILDASGALIPQEETFFGKGSAATDMYLRNGQLFLAGKFKTPDYKEAYAFVKVLLNPGATPAAPTSLVVTMPNPGSLSVTWTDNSSDRLGVVIERAVDNLTTFEILDTLAANVTLYSDQLPRNHFHAYRVRAFNDAGYSSYSNIDSLKWAPAPSGTLTLSVAPPTTAEAKLAWQGSIQNHDGFIVELQTANSSYVALDTLPASARNFTHAIVRNSEYRFRVKAFNPNGQVISQTVLVEWRPAPSGTITLAITQPAAGQAKLSWQGAILYHTGFIIEMQSGSNTFTALDTLASTAATFSHPISRHTKYNYRVKAFNENGVVISQSVLAEWNPLPGGAVTVTLTDPAQREAALSWTHSALYHDGFIIERSTQATTGFTAIDTVAKTATSYTHITDGRRAYHYRVVAYNPTGRVVSNVVAMIITGIEDLYDNSIALYPNPATDHVLVSISDDTESATVTMIDGQGRVLSELKNLSTGTHRFELATVAPGVYLMTLNVNGKRVKKRIVKE